MLALTTAALTCILSQVAPPASPPGDPDTGRRGDRLGVPQVEPPLPELTIIPDIGPVRDIRRIGWGYGYTSGLLADAQGNVYFVDTRAQKLYCIGLDGTVRTAMENTAGITDLDFLPDGRFVGTIGRDGRVVAFDLETKQIETLADSCDGAKFIRPSDLKVDSRGGIYVTDTGGIGTGLVGEGEPRRAVFYISPSPADSAQPRAVSLLIDDVSSPSGVLLSPDERTLWILPAAENRLLAYPVEAPGKLGAQTKAADLRTHTGRPVRGGDGLTRDVHGNLYLTVPAAMAVQVVAPNGQILGHYRFPEKPSNVVFGGKDFTTLFVAAHKSVYAIPLAVEGQRPRFSPSAK